MPIEFGTIAVSDGIAMGHEGMKASLMSRDLIADSVELVMHAERFDALVGIAGCDKSEPGMMMAMARLNLPSVYLYGGTILPGTYGGRDITIQDVFEAVGAHAKGTIDDAELLGIERAACPTTGSCAGMYTANTMAAVGEAIGLSLPGAASPPAVDYRREVFARESGIRAAELVAAGGPLPRDILTKEAFENAITIVMALAGSTNAVLHLLAIAREAGVDLQLDDFDRISRATPHLVDVRPAGKFVMSDLDRVGGVPVVMRELLDAGLLHGDCLTVTGKTQAENLAALDPPAPDGDIVHAARRCDPPVGRDRDPPRQPRPERRGREGGRRRGAHVRRGRAAVRLRAGGVRRRHVRRDRPRRRDRDPLRGPEGVAGDAGDARRHRGRRRRGSRQGRRADHRRPVLGRDEGLQRRAHRAGGVRRRTARSGRGRRSDPDRRRRAVARAARRRRDAGGATPGWVAPEPRYTTGALAKYAKLVGGADHGAVTG